MSRLEVRKKSKAQLVVDNLYEDLERRIIASPPGLCPVDMTASFLKLFHAQTCGKCVPCRIGLGVLEDMLEDVLDGKATLETLSLIERTAKAIYDSADCAIGYEAGRMVLKGLEGFREDFIEHITNGHCSCHLEQPVPCVALCPAGVDVPGYISLIADERYADAVKLIRKDNPFVTSCALVCEHPCETKCRRNFVDDAVNIRRNRQPGLIVQGGERLIQQQDLRLCQQSPADHQFSFHTTGKFSHCPSTEIDQTTKFQQFFCLFPDFFPGHKVQPSLIFHHLIHRHVLTHGILLGNHTDFSFQIRTLSCKLLTVYEDFSLCRKKKG